MMKNLTDSSLESVEFANSLAEKAREISMSGFRQSVDIKLKKDKSPVTIIDQNVETMVRELVESTFPEHGFLGEEFGSIKLDSSDVWVVDPIDGTRSFITGWPIWGTLICKLTDGYPDIGLIDMPAIDERWVGICGKSCFFVDASGSQQECKVSNCNSLANAKFYTTNILYFEAEDRSKIETILEQAAVPRFGGDCYSYGLLASGHIDLVIEAQLEPYDFLALVPVVEGAGGIITDWEGNRLTRHSGNRVIAAATPELHSQALALLK